MRVGPDDAHTDPECRRGLERQGPFTIEAGQTIDTTVFVDRDQFPIGAFTVDAGLTAATGAVGTVTVHGMSFGPFGAGAASGTLTAGGGAAGCSGSCITSAQLVPGANAADVGLDVTTNVAATFELYVLGGAPMFFNGELAGATPVASTSTPASSWSTGLGDLAPDTTYHLALAAIDQQDRTQWATHAFTTLPAPSQYTGNDPEPGCSAGCVVEAQLSPTDDHDVVGLHVETHTPAKITAQVGTGLKWTDGQPVVTGNTSTDSTFGEYETSWDATFTGLTGDTTYHVLVRATDDNGNTDIRTGQFHTNAAPPVGVIVRFEKLLVRWDADSSKINRGELRFAWGVDDTQLGARGESKHHTGDQITLETDTNGWFVPFEPGEQHLFTLAGGERDPDPWYGDAPCEAVEDHGVHDTTPTWRQQDRHDCDNVKWNTAPMWMTAEEIADLPWCSEYGFDGPAGNRKCHDIDSPDYGPDVPRFTSIVSFDVVG